jgi:hypothetical protein
MGRLMVVRVEEGPETDVDVVQGAAKAFVETTDLLATALQVSAVVERHRGRLDEAVAAGGASAAGAPEPVPWCIHFDRGAILVPEPHRSEPRVLPRVGDTR